ncbi:MAG: hypothetical protein GF331_24835 [Chitinivibrionales bacterium]|nr:hypothetical protein [Chitinivibrionales bacterium]
MKRTPLAAVVMVLACLAPLIEAEPISIEGRVVDTATGSQEPAVGVWVFLKGYGAGDSTGADGTYHIVGNTGTAGHRPPVALTLSKPVFRGNVLLFPVEKPSSRVSVALYSLLGRQVVSVLDRRYHPGVYSVDLGAYAAGGLASSLYMVGVHINGRSSFFKLLNVTHSRRGRTGSVAEQALTPTAVLTKSFVAAADTLVVLQVATATGDTLAYSLRPVVNLVGTMPDVVLCVGCDSDGDGLPDDREIHAYHTNPRQADTDGDGWDDREEILQFTPPAKFHPAIADLPSIEVVIVDPPEVGLNWTSTVGSNTGSEVVVGSESSIEQSTTNSFGTSIGLEHGWTVSGETGYDDGFVFSVGGELSGSYSYEAVTEWGYGTSRSNSKSWQRAMSMETSHQISYDEGYIAVAAYIRNNSAIGYTVNNIQLAAYKMDYDSDNGFEHISHLELEGLGSGFTVPPNQTAGPFDFSNTLSVGEAKALVVESEAFMTKLSGHNISMQDELGNAVDFTHEYTTTAARTALVRIDYGPRSGKKPLMYRVATKVKYNENHVGPIDMYFPYYMTDAMRTISVGYDTGSYDGNAGLTAVDGQTQEPDENAFWFVLHTTLDDTMLYSVRDTSFDFDSIAIDAYHTVELIYSRDRDGDGVPERTEEMVGTSDSLVDTDNDGLTDREEIVGWSRDTSVWKTDPLYVDTDGDGVIDPEDDDPLHRPLGTGATIGLVSLVDPDHRRDVFCDEHLTSFGVYDTFRTSICSLQIAPEEIAHRISVVRYGRHDTLTIDSLPCTDTRDAAYECRIPMGIGENEVVVTVISEDGLVTKEYSFTNIMAPLRVPDWEVKPMRPGSYKTILTRVADFGELVQEHDTRVQGLVIVRKAHRVNLRRTLHPRYQFNFSEGEVLYDVDTVRVVAVKNSADVDSAMYELADTDLVPGTRYFYTVYTFGEVDDTIYYSDFADAIPQDTVTSNTVRVIPTIVSLDAQNACCVVDCDYSWVMRVNGVVRTSSLGTQIGSGGKHTVNVACPPDTLTGVVSGLYACSPSADNRIRIQVDSAYCDGLLGDYDYQRNWLMDYTYVWPADPMYDNPTSCATNVVYNDDGVTYSGTSSKDYWITTSGGGCGIVFKLLFDWEYIN